VKETISLLRRTYGKWSEHQAPRLGASVAFYSLLSFAPLLVLVTAVIALAFGQQSAQGLLINDARQFIGDRGAETVESLLKNAQKPASGVFASLVAFVTLLFGASGVFTELQAALNLMWGATLQTSTGFRGMVQQRLFSFGMVLSVGFLLLVSLLLSAGLAYMGRSFEQLLPLPPSLLEAINFVVSFAVITVLFALMFKYVPAAKISWRDVWVGAVGTALLFTVGKLLLGLYLGKASVGSTYGAAGSLVALIVWIYYSAQIFFFGAEFTHVYAEAHTGKSADRAKHAGASQQHEEPYAAVQDAVQNPVQSAASTEQPKAMAAAVGYARPVLPVPAPSPISSLPATSTGVMQPVARPAAEPIPISAPHSTPKRSTPKLIMAVGLGFLLGRFFVRKGGRQA
jgi:membrane protein